MKSSQLHRLYSFELVVTMNVELAGMWKEAVVTSVKVLSLCLPVRTD
jgi:hypothetical protein